MLSRLGRRHHAAQFGETTVYFTFASAHAPQDIHELANRLLKSEIAETVSSPRGGGVRLAPRYKKHIRLMFQAAKLGGAMRAAEEGEWRAYVKRHPILGAKYFLKSLWLKVSELTRRRAPAEPEEEFGSADMVEVIADIKKDVYRRQAISAIQQYRDANMYRPAYLESEPYLRMTLRHLALEVKALDPSTSTNFAQRVDPMLTIHRSGVVLLTLAIKLPTPLTSIQLVQQSHATDIDLAWTELSEPVIEFAAREHHGPQKAGEWLQEQSDSSRWMRFEHDNPGVSLVDVFRLYWDAVISAGELTSVGEWQIYPTTCIDRVECCRTEREWRSHHDDELAALLLKWEGFKHLRESARKSMPTDSSLSKSASTWHSTGSTVTINWSPTDTPDFESDLWTLNLVDNFLLQSWQIRRLLSEMNQSKHDVKSVRMIQRRLVTGLDEFYQSAMSYGTAQVLVSRLLDESGSSRAHEQLLARADQLSTMLASERAERTASRGLVVALGSVLLAAVFGLPAIAQTVKVAESIPAGSGAYSSVAPLRWLGDFGPVGSWYAFLAILGCLCIALAFTARPKIHLPRRPRQPAGYEWPFGTIPIVRRGDDTKDDNDPASN